MCRNFSEVKSDAFDDNNLNPSTQEILLPTSNESDANSSQVDGFFDSGPIGVELMHANMDDEHGDVQSSTDSSSFKIGDEDEHGYYKKGFGRHQVFALIEIIQMSNIDTVAQTFACRFRLELEWMCTEEEHRNHKDEGFAPIWSPGLPTLPTLVRQERAELDGKAMINRRKNMHVLKQNYVIEGTFSEAFELQSYPFDSQEFPITMIWPKPDMVLHPAMTREFLKFNVAKMALGEWDFSAPMIEIASKKEKIVTEDLRMRSVDYPLLTVSLRAMRVYKTTVINIYIILSLITFAGIGAFCLEVDEGGDRMNHASTVLLSTIAFLYIIESSLPKLTYMTITDYFVFTGTVFVLLITIEIAILSFVITHLDGINISFLITHLDGINIISVATDTWILLFNLALWILYVGGYSALIYFHTIPRARKFYAAPGQDRCVFHSEMGGEEGGEVDFSLGSSVAVVPTDGVYQYYWELNRDHKRTFSPTWRSNDYGRDWNEYFQAYIELSPSDEDAQDYVDKLSKRNAKFKLPALKYICLKLLKITGDKNIPAGYISVQTKKEKFSSKSLRAKEGLKISENTSAEIQVRSNVNDHRPCAFTFLPFSEFHMSKDKKVMSLDRGYKMMNWYALEDEDNDEEEFNFFDFL
mmetsp:Transcript_4439/g.9272  ORF Transcript_4439/g.9272 Transcript_4439/m.9272 type:complete len:639 (+) Transcript_4439:42-1958(+)